MKIAIHQINPKLGDFKYNSQIIIDSIKQSQKEKAELIVFPELALSGYPGFDVLERPSFVKTQWKQIEKIKKVVKPGVLVVVGGISENKNTKAKPFFNSAIIIEGSKKVKIIPKSLLPSYDVFDESRFFEAGNFQSNLIRFKNKNILIGVCEDFWFWDTKATQWLGGENPLKKYKNKKIDLIVQINGSPFSKKALEKRKAIALKTSRYLNSPMIYVNLVGGQDELIFDGNSFIISVEKKSNLPCYYLKNFEPDNFSFFLEKLKEIKQKQIKKNKNQVLFNSLCLGLSDFVLKNGFSKVHL
jgi:NAD+ synthase (glutamine-hydrolysing)